MHRDECWRRRHQESSEQVKVVGVPVEPEIPRGGRKDHRHAVVHSCHGCIWVRGDDRARTERLLVAVRSAPYLPEPRKGIRIAVGATDEEGLLLSLLRIAGVPPPLVEAVSRDEAAPLLEGGLERTLGGERLAARVDHLRADLRVRGPEWDQPPTERIQVSSAPIGEDRVHIVRRGHVVRGREQHLWLLRAEVGRDLIRGRRGDVATTHQSKPTWVPLRADVRCLRADLDHW